MRWVLNRIKLPKSRKAEYIAKIKKALSPFPEEDRDEDFYERKARELYIIENIK